MREGAKNDNYKGVCAGFCSTTTPGPPGGPGNAPIPVVVCSGEFLFLTTFVSATERPLTDGDRQGFIVTGAHVENTEAQLYHYCCTFV